MAHTFGVGEAPLSRFPWSGWEGAVSHASDTRVNIRGVSHSLAFLRDAETVGVRRHGNLLDLSTADAPATPDEQAAMARALPVAVTRNFNPMIERAAKAVRRTPQIRRARSSCGGRRRPGAKRVARSNSPPGDSEGESEPGEPARRPVEVDRPAREAVA